MRDSQRLAGRFADPVIITHHGGHVIPSDPRVIGCIIEFAEQHGRIAHGEHTPAPAASRPD
jgi:hypothetical protein